MGIAEEKFRLYNLQVSDEEAEIEGPSFEDIKDISTSSIKSITWGMFTDSLDSLADPLADIATPTPLKDFAHYALKSVGMIMIGEIADNAQNKFVGANATYSLHYEISEGPRDPSEMKLMSPSSALMQSIDNLISSVSDIAEMKVPEAGLFSYMYEEEDLENPIE